jgi:4-hydroxybenzoate polyprenyltransferase
MRVKFDTSVLGQTKWQQYAIRFMFGGCITVNAGLVASKFGPAVGGLLLAFPAIFPASATLIEKHEKEKKEKQGLGGTMRGRQAASVDAAGSAMGSVGLLVFALLVWQFVPNNRAWIVLPGAMVAWLAVSVLIWEIRLRVRTVR